MLTKDLSRLGRDYILTGYYIEKFFPENQVRYISVLDGIDTGDDSVFNDMTPFRAVFNDMYAKDISNKIKSVKHNKQNQGLFIGGKAPFGYKLNKKIPNKLFIDEEAKPIIERIFHEAVLGLSCKKIASNLNLDNISTPSEYALNHGFKVSKHSQLWSDSRIREILLNEVYIGNMVQGRMKKVNYKSKKNIRLPYHEWKIVSNTHEPLIDLSTFLRAKEMINLRKQTRVKSHDYILKGFVYCHECKQKMYCSSRHLASGIKYYFRCSTNTKSSTNTKLGIDIKSSTNTKSSNNAKLSVDTKSSTNTKSVIDAKFSTNTEVRGCTPHSIRMDYVQNEALNALNNLITKCYSTTKFKDIAEKCYNNYLKTFSSTGKVDFYKAKISQISIEIDKLYSDKIARPIGGGRF